MLPLTAILLLSLVAPPAADNDPLASGRAAKGHLAKRADSDGHYPGATEVLTSTFERTRDEEFFGWPPGWTRPHGPGLPRYLHMRVNEDHPPPGGRCLRVELDGGAATAFGPPVAVDPAVNYVLEGYVKTVALRHDAAWISLTFKDSARAKLAETASAKINGTTPWQKVRVGPLAPPPGASRLIVGVHVAPQGASQDLHGSASFGSLWLGRLPRVVLTARDVEMDGPSAAGKSSGPRGGDAARFLVFTRDRQAGARPIEIACLVSGYTAPKFEVRLELQDSDGRTVARHQEGFSTVQALAATAKPSSPGRPENVIAPHDGGFTRATWSIPGDMPGYYRVRAEVVADDERIRMESTPRAELGLAIVDRQQPPPGSEFGWTLDPGDVSLGLVPLGDLLTQAGVRWVKFPLVCSLRPNDPPAKNTAAAGKLPSDADAFGTGNSRRTQPDRIEPLISFSDRLALAGVQLAGVLHPPSANAEQGQSGADLKAVEAFALEPKTWYPSVEPVLARLGTEIRFWQIGDDRDSAWTGCGELPAVVSRVKSELDQIGQDLAVGFAWDLSAPLPVDARGSDKSTPRIDGPQNVIAGDRLKPGRQTKARQAPWRFLSLPCDDAMTDAELGKRLDATASSGVARWLAIDALPRTGHSNDDRIAQLVERMIAARIHGADGVFFDHPFDPERGLVGCDGSPGELFLPWRTTALMLGGLPYAGDIDLAGGTPMHCFGGNGRYVGVVAAGAPLRDAVYLGDHLQSCDVWGRTAFVPTNLDAGLRSNIDAQRLPTFLTGLDGAITQWQLSVRFAPPSLPSIPTSAAATSVELKNTLPQAVAGRLRIVTPRDWQVEPSSAEFRLEPGAAWKLPLHVVLPNDVLAGPQTAALKFELQADHLYRFIAYRPIDVAGGDVDISGRTVLDDRGDLNVRQTVENKGKRAVAFRCSLAAPDRRRQWAEILVPPHAQSEAVYSLPDGRELVGKTLWLRAEEIDGPRVLNYRLEAR